MKIKFSLAVVAAVVSLGLSNLATAQHCSSCSTAGVDFSYPVTNTGALGHLGNRGHGHPVQELRNRLQHHQELNAKITARNDAWPRPFSCLDRQDYAGIWSTMLNAGTETQCVLDSNFFGEENELNRVGIDRVRGIAINMPSNDRTVFVHRTNNNAVDNIRIAAVRETLDTYYGHLGPIGVRLSDHVPRTVSGAQVQLTAASRAENAPVPIIEIGSGEAISDDIGQN